MTISLDQAKSLAKKAISLLGAASNDQFVIMEDKTVETERGWVFFYNTQEFMKTRDPVSALAGNGPIFVKRSGDVRELPSAISWEEAIIWTPPERR